MYPFAFAVVVGPIYDSNNEEYYYQYDTGMGFTTSFTDATKQLEQYYGEELSAIKHIELFEESTLILCNERTIADYRECNYAPFQCDYLGNPIKVVQEVVSENEEIL